MFKAVMILPLVFLLFILQHCNSLSCFPPCQANPDCSNAPKPSDCPSQRLTKTAIPCNCCRECAKAEGQECEGLWGSSGECADYLECVGEDTQNSPGVCRYRNSVSPPVFPPVSPPVFHPVFPPVSPPVFPPVLPPVFPPVSSDFLPRPPSDLTNRVRRNRKLILNLSCGYDAWILVERRKCPVAFTDPNFRRLREVCRNEGNWADIFDRRTVKSMAVWRGHGRTMGVCDNAPVCLACPALNDECPWF